MINVTAAIIIDSGKVFIARRKTTARMPGVWEFPGGKIEAGETPEQCLRRELREEFDIEVEVGDHLGTSVHHYEFGTIALMAYRTRVTGGEFKLNDHEEVAWATAEDLEGVVFAPADLPFVEMIRKGEIAL